MARKKKTAKRILAKKIPRAQAPRTTVLTFKMECFRQTLHIMFGVIVALAAANFGRDLLLLGLLAFLAVFLTVTNIEIIGHRTIFSVFFKELERKAEIPGKGVLMYVFGLLLLYSFSPNLLFAIGVTLVLSFGDGLATIVGRRGHRRIPWNPAKTLEGSLAFIASSALAGAYFLGVAAAVIYALVLALVESFDWGIDDNLAIPIAALLAWTVIPV